MTDPAHPSIMAECRLESMDEELLERLRSAVDRSVVSVLPVGHHCDDLSQLCDGSVLKGQDTVDIGAMVRARIAKDASLDRAVGCFLGMALGDGVGAPLEFTPACSTSGTGVTFQHDSKTLGYVEEKNAFGLQRGQWTDDASMGICMAESLLARGGYHGGDVRVRFHLWWFFGYCNAFRHDPQRWASVGLGGNIGQSLDDLRENYTGKTADDVPARYQATGEDAGNGSLMRLAPIPLRYHCNVQRAMDMAEESSYATHPGPDAANCCRFVAFFVCRAMHGSFQKVNIKTFTQETISAFLSQHVSEELLGQIRPTMLRRIKSDATPISKLRALLQSKPPSSKEACWNWKADRLAVEETLTARGRDYNGYPVTAGYFGSYCMDGLAMALWALFHSTSFTDCILKTVNLRGDADTTAAIAGQLSGAFYGYSSLLADSCGQHMLRDIRQWDPLYELEMRALLLHRDGCRG